MDSLLLLTDALKGKIRGILNRHTKYVLSTKAIHGQLSIEYTTIPMKKPCKEAIIYYAGDTVYLYRQMIWLYQRCTEDGKLQMTTVCDMLDDYVNAWSSLKEISDANIKGVENFIQTRMSTLKYYLAKFDELKKKFDEANVHDDTEMVDHFTINLYTRQEEFPYRRAYQHFFKKDKISDSLVQKHLDEDRAILDKMINMMTVLYLGWNKIGKGDSFDQYRKRQIELITLIDIFANVIEKDMELYEKFMSLNEVIIAFKIYPKEKKTEEF